MLTKLVKYNLNYRLKSLSAFYVLAVVFALCTRIFFALEQSFFLNLLGQIFTGATISMIANILINNVIRCWVGFGENLYGDQSYLTHTLPIEKSTHYVAKVLAGVISMGVSALVIVGTLGVAYYTPQTFEKVKRFLFPVGELVGIRWWLLTALILFLLFLELLHMLQSGFGGMIVGNRCLHRKKLFSVVFGALIYFIGQGIACIPLGVAALVSSSVRSLFVAGAVITPGALVSLLWLAIVGYFLLFFITMAFNIKQFQKGVNVD